MQDLNDRCFWLRSRVSVCNTIYELCINVYIFFSFWALYWCYHIVISLFMKFFHVHYAIDARSIQVFIMLDLRWIHNARSLLLCWWFVPRIPEWGVMLKFSFRMRLALFQCINWNRSSLVFLSVHRNQGKKNVSTVKTFNTNDVKLVSFNARHNTYFFQTSFIFEFNCCLPEPHKTCFHNLIFNIFDSLLVLWIDAYTIVFIIQAKIVELGWRTVLDTHKLRLLCYGMKKMMTQIFVPFF